MLAVLRSDRNRKHSTFSLVHGTLHPIHANPLEVIVLLSLYLAVLDNQSNEDIARWPRCIKRGLLGLILQPASAAPDHPHPGEKGLCRNSRSLRPDWADEVAAFSCSHIAGVPTSASSPDT